MAFNDEQLAVAVSTSDIPIISAIGHETDTTMIDYVSDLRASTPTAAAELVVPVKLELTNIINGLNQRMIYRMDNIFKENLTNKFQTGGGENCKKKYCRIQKRMGGNTSN